MGSNSVIHRIKLGKNVKIGPFCYIGENVIIEDDCKLHSHVVIDGNTVIGSGSEIFSFATIGSTPQDLKYKGEKTKILLGKIVKLENM